ncbi:unnamed protein product [Effrenium voratum]|nr:unnamed protein product [Effrenium voratum]
MSIRVLAPTDRYEACVNDGGKEHLLGTGAYGEVVLVRKRGAGYRAMKRCVDCLSPSDPCTLKRMYREIAVLRQVHHDNIIALTDVFLPHVGHDLFLFFQAASCDLEHAIRYNMLDELAQQSIGCDVIRALAYLHASDLIHRDLKPSNVLLDESGAKLCDFGLVRLIGLYPKGLTEYVGMRWYRAPELFLGSRCYNQSIDVWSYGCVVAEMALGRPLLAGIDSEEQLGLVVGLLGRPTELEAELPGVPLENVPRAAPKR